MSEKLSDKKTWVHPLCVGEYVIEEEEVFSIGYVGDMHLHHTNFRSRVDDYPNTCLEKLGILRREMLSKGIKYLFCPGDIFHIPKERTEFEFAVMQEFMKFKEAGIKVFITNGNHDLTSERMDSIEKSSLGLLYLSKAVIPFTKVTFKRKDKTPIVVTGLHFPNDAEPITDLNAYNILACHKFYDVAGEPSIFKKDLDYLGYDMYLLNHDHVAYPLEKVPTSSGSACIIRPGSFMRATSHSYNTARLVYMDEIKFNGHVQVERHTLPVRDPHDIFPASVMDKLEDNSLRDMARQMSDLVTKMYEIEESSMTVYTIMDQSPIDDKIKERITAYLEANGIFRKEVAVID